MARPLKLVLLGGSGSEMEELVKAIAKEFGATEVEHGSLAGTVVHRFSTSLPLKEGESLAFAVFAVAGDWDFHGLYKPLLENADGVVGLIPADLARLQSNQRILGPLNQRLQESRATAAPFAYLLQYHWARQATAPSVTQVDQALGINPKNIARVFTQAGGVEQAKGIQALLAMLSV